MTQPVEWVEYVGAPPVEHPGVVEVRGARGAAVPRQLRTAAGGEAVQQPAVRRWGVEGNPAAEGWDVGRDAIDAGRAGMISCWERE
jgi:hypothetical protein